MQNMARIWADEERTKEQMIRQHQLEMQRLEAEHEMRMREIAAQRARDSVAARQRQQQAALDAQKEAELASLRKEVERQAFELEWAKVERVHPDAKQVIREADFRPWASRQTGRMADLVSSTKGEELAAAITEYKRQKRAAASAQKKVQ